MQRTLIDDRYELSEPLGGGGMAYVYLAHDLLLDRDVAVKLLRGQYAEDKEFVERFRREAQNAASLSHPNIVQTYDRGESGDGGYYIAMEHVPGGALSERIQRDGALAAHVAAEVASQVADALGAAHEAGLIHRDIKPHNVLVTERGDVKVADFGIARAAEETSISRTSAVLGTAAYMSPEQALGREVDPRSDLYSLGVVLYEMLTGGVPFTGASPTAVSLMHVNEEPRPPAEVEPDVPAGMNALVMELLAKEPSQRYGSATELVEDLERVSEGLAPLNAGVGGIAVGSPAAEATTVDADGVDEEAPEPAAAPRTMTSPSGNFRMHRGSSRRTRLRRLLAVAALIVSLIGAIGWLAWPTDGPGVAGSLDGVPELPGKAGEAIAGGPEALADAVTGGEQVEVPRVEGLAEGAATERLQQAGFEAETRSRQSTAQDAGLVLEQSVAGGGKAEEGSTILLAAGSGPNSSAGTSTGAAAQEAPAQDAPAQDAPAQSIEAPDLVGLSYPEAGSRLEEAGLTLGGVQEVASQSAPAGEIVEQDPGPQASVEQGTPVYLTTSTGPPQSGSPQGGPPQGGSGQGASGGGEAGAGGSGWQSTPGAANGGDGSAGGDGGYGSDGGANAGAGGGANTDPYTAPAEDAQEDESDDSEEQDESSGYEQYEPED